VNYIKLVVKLMNCHLFYYLFILSAFKRKKAIYVYIWSCSIVPCIYNKQT